MKKTGMRAKLRICNRDEKRDDRDENIAKTKFKTLNLK